jgi:hypothetical protein
MVGCPFRVEAGNHRRAIRTKEKNRFRPTGNNEVKEMTEETERYFVAFITIDSDTRFMNEDKARRFAAALEELKNCVVDVRGETYIFAVTNGFLFKKELAEMRREMKQ